MSFRFNHYEKTPISTKSNLLTSIPISTISSRIFSEKEKALIESEEGKNQPEGCMSPMRGKNHTGENYRVSFNQ